MGLKNPGTTDTLSEIPDLSYTSPGLRALGFCLVSCFQRKGGVGHAGLQCGSATHGMGIVLLERPTMAAGCGEVRYFRGGGTVGRRTNDVTQLAAPLPVSAVVSRHLPSRKPNLIDLQNRTDPTSSGCPISAVIFRRVVFAARARTKSTITERIA